MGKKRVTNEKKSSNKGVLIITLIVVLFSIFLAVGEQYNLIDTEQLSILLYGDKSETENEIVEELSASKQTDKTSPETTELDKTSDLIYIYFWDVGQADSILLTSDDKTMLIDAGTNEAGKTVVNNIKALGIEKIDYLIGTHPHEDHIGGLDDVINSFEIGRIFMPKIQTNTKTFEDVLDAIKNNGLKVTAPEKGYEFELGKINCEVMLCGSGTEQEQKENLNLSSIILRATYGEQSYLFTGDAETENEKARDWPQTNVLKVGHHGSNTSSSAKFLSQLKPEIAIISCGKNNKYGHPKEITLNKLNKIGATIYRTDEMGTITLISDGKTNQIICEK